MKVAELTAAYVRSILHYDPETGELIWKDRPREHFKTQRSHNSWNSRYYDKPAGCKDRDGYIQVYIDGTPYRAHRVIWLIMTGKWPANEIDHKDTAHGNNRWINLRDATRHQNEANRRRNSNNTSGYKGVSWCKRREKWVSQITAYGRSYNLGYFDEDKIEDAAAAYESAAKKLHGEFARAA